MHKHIRKSIQALGLALVFVAPTASAGIWLGGGIEYFTLGEYLDYNNGAGNKYIDLGRESGFMPFVDASADIAVTERARLAISGRAFGGNVDYASRSLSPAVSSSIDYAGLRAEGGIIYKPLPHGDNSDVSFVAMAGYDTWTRKLKATGEEEEWKMPFVRLGAQLEPNEGSPWTGRGGLMIPFGVTDHYKPDNVTYKPEPSISYYVGVGRRFSRFVEAGLNYETIRFSDLNRSSNYATPRVEIDTYQFYLKVGI